MTALLTVGPPVPVDAATADTRRASLAANRASKARKVAASREERVTAMFAAYADPADVPPDVWDSAVEWASVTGACFADIGADVAAVVPDGWNTDDIDAALAAAVERMIDDYNGRA